jgi:hypothetical protein
MIESQRSALHSESILVLKQNLIELSLSQTKEGQQHLAKSKKKY